jgi:DNA-binding transcriptional regulator YdaS (Cro superfamily)
MNIDTKRRAEIANSASIADPYLYQILTKRREASPELCVVLERVSGGQLNRRGLRPTDWHLIWPELIDAAKAPA